MLEVREPAVDVFLGAAGFAVSPPSPSIAYPTPAIARRKLGVPEGDVLEAVDSWAADKQRWGRDIIEEIEEEVCPSKMHEPVLCALYER